MKAKIVYTNHINWKMSFTQQLFYQQIKTASEYVGVRDWVCFPATSSGLQCRFRPRTDRSASSLPLREGFSSQLCGLCTKPNPSKPN